MTNSLHALEIVPEFAEQEQHRPLSAAIAAGVMKLAEVEVHESINPTEAVHRSFNMDAL